MSTLSEDSLCQDAEKGCQLNISHAQEVEAQIIDVFYQRDWLQKIVNITLQVMLDKQQQGLELPYFSIDLKDKLLELDIYVIDPEQGQKLNLEARNKDYATNILSYPSDLPTELLDIISELPLGELVICHTVVERQADEQNKTTQHHLAHLLVHGILHLLGFDHELGDNERIQMEEFEINILQLLNIANPY